MRSATSMKTPSESLFLASWVLSLNATREVGRVQNGELPTSFRDFEFLQGEFDGLSESGPDFDTVFWKSERLLNGWIIRDEIKRTDENGVIRGESVQVRTFSEDLQQWKSVLIDLRKKELKTFSGWRSGNAVIMEQDKELHLPFNHQKRHLYIPGGSRKFTLVKQSSVDGGESWVEDSQPLTLHKIM